MGWSDKETETKLMDLRRQIDAADQELLALLNRRAALSLEVGRLKADSGELVFKPFREKELMERLESSNNGPLPREHLKAIYREILSSSRSLQRPQRVAYLGPEGTFSYFAGLEFFGQSALFQPMPDLHAAFRAVDEEEADLAVVPLENSLQGTVGQSLDLFLRFPCFIQSELFLRVSHSLMARVESISSVRTVYSHSQPLAQCGAWLRANLPAARIIPVESTAAAGRRVLEDDARGEASAAIGHRGLAGLLGLNALASGIEDLPDNWTRFVVIAKQAAAEEIKDKTSLLFTLPDRPGSLAEVLDILARAGINMTKLESRPMRGERWKYVFFVDVECDLDQERYKAALNDLASHCHTLRFLGSYPAGPYLAGASVNGDAQ